MKGWMCGAIFFPADLHVFTHVIFLGTAKFCTVTQVWRGRISRGSPRPSLHPNEQDISLISLPTPLFEISCNTRRNCLQVRPCPGSRQKCYRHECRRAICLLKFWHFYTFELDGLSVAETTFKQHGSQPTIFMRSTVNVAL